MRRADDVIRRREEIKKEEVDGEEEKGWGVGEGKKNGKGEEGVENGKGKEKWYNYVKIAKIN